MEERNPCYEMLNWTGVWDRPEQTGPGGHPVQGGSRWPHPRKMDRHGGQINGPADLPRGVLAQLLQADSASVSLDNQGESRCTHVDD